MRLRVKSKVFAAKLTALGDNEQSHDYLVLWKSS